MFLNRLALKNNPLPNSLSVQPKLTGVPGLSLMDKNDNNEHQINKTRAKYNTGLIQCLLSIPYNQNASATPGCSVFSHKKAKCLKMNQKPMRSQSGIWLSIMFCQANELM